jgi:integrase
MAQCSELAVSGKIEGSPRLAIFSPDSEAPADVQAVETPAATAAKVVITTSGKAAKRKKKKAEKFPLWLHPLGYWAKKVRGKIHYFGKDQDKALAEWMRQKDDLLAGREPKSKAQAEAEGTGLVVGKLCDDFLNWKRELLTTGELSQRTFTTYLQSCQRLSAALGKHKLVEELTAADFQSLRNALARDRSPVTLRGDVLNIRMVFKWGYDHGLIKNPPRYGQAFAIPGKATLRRARQASGKRMFEADELRKIIDAAPQPMKAMILLGINCGFGATDCSTLPRSAVDLKAGWIDFPRPKTAVERRCPLWPETIAALQEAFELDREARDPADKGAAFLTRCGQRWVRSGATGAVIDSVCGEMRKILTDLGIKRDKLNFYALRHTFETIGGGSRDQIAVNAIMGHADSTMAAAYREHIDDERLQAVVNHIRAWLFPKLSGNQS